MPLQSRWHWAGAYDPDSAVRKQWLEGWSRQTRFAKAAGAECIGLWPGGPLGQQTVEVLLQSNPDALEVGPTFLVVLCIDHRSMDKGRESRAQSCGQMDPHDIINPSGTESSARYP